MCSSDLVSRAERAAQRILQLEDQIREMELDQDNVGAEILNLQIQLKAIELQALPYIRTGADPELDASIRNWKADWAAMKQKRAAMRGEGRQSMMGVSSPGSLSQRSSVMSSNDSPERVLRISRHSP